MEKNVSIFRNITSGAATILGGGYLLLPDSLLVRLPVLLCLRWAKTWPIGLSPIIKTRELFMNSKTFMQFDKGKGVAAYGKEYEQNARHFLRWTIER